MAKPDMKLCAIFICWHDWDLLDYAYNNMRPLVDGIIVIGSNVSNFGETSAIPEKWRQKMGVFCREPQFRDARNSETDKRNFGLSIARQQGYNYFIICDSDEFYEPEPFLKEKERFLNPNLKGLVCNCQTYFKSPQLTIGLDTTLVPFIHELTPTIKHEFNKRYPFAWDKTGIRIDPTRSLNITSGVERSNLIMHHYSWVRKDYQVKIRNSTARNNLQRSTILNDLTEAKPGYYCQFYERSLIKCDNLFNLPEW